MRSLSKLMLLAVVLVLTACKASLGQPLQWYKGNLHTHSYWSDGDEFPEMIMDWYKSKGYQFLALSDHNILAKDEKWITVAKSKMYEDDFAKYLSKYGEKWVVHKNDTGRIQVKLKTYSEYKPLFEDKNFLIIQSEEITDRYGDKMIHMNATNIQQLIVPQGGQSVTDVMQRNIDQVIKQRAESGTPMIPHINHPNFFFSVSTQDIIDLHGERFFEVYNGHPLVNNYGDSLHPGTEQMWDNINIAYLKKNQPLLYGLATDDSHNYHQFGSAYSNAGRGWIMVRSSELQANALITALEQGDFYASTGVVLDHYSVVNNAIHIKVKSEPGVQYTIEFIGLKTGQQKTQLISDVRGTEATFQLTKGIAFVRARVTSDKQKPNPFREGDVEMAWTQPISYRK
ncbi:MAG TPA: hypothetical protein VK666_21465 [Chryseolinea sp.]|nr:hypothetical protein [Chryseolinea sp.]